MILVLTLLAAPTFTIDLVDLRPQPSKAYELSITAKTPAEARSALEALAWKVRDDVPAASLWRGQAAYRAFPVETLAGLPLCRTMTPFALNATGDLYLLLSTHDPERCAP